MINGVLQVRISATKKMCRSFKVIHNGVPTNISIAHNSVRRGSWPLRIISKMFIRTLSLSNITINSVAISLVPSECKVRTKLSRCKLWGCCCYPYRYNRSLLERASDNFNLQHGGENQYVSKAIFSEGRLNPYRGSGVTNYNNKTSLFISTNCKCSTFWK